MLTSTETFLDSSISNLGVVPKDSSISSPTDPDRDSGMDPQVAQSIDPRLLNLSYSSALTLHACPRKYQLYKLRTPIVAPEDLPKTVTFAFGHAVGAGTALVFANASIEEIIWKMFLEWDCSLVEEDLKAKKSFWAAVYCVMRLKEARADGFLSHLEVITYEGQRAIELSFSISLPNGFKYRGHVDAVLRDNETGKIIVLERKTTKHYSVNPATYQNSAQAIGYSVILDHIVPDISSYEVLYLVYSSLGYQEFPFYFSKTYSQRAQWIREILFDIDHILEYNEVGIFPMRGESCFTFGRECEYLQVCTLPTSHLTPPLPVGELDSTKYQVEVTLVDLIESQLARSDPERSEGARSGHE